MKNEIDLLPEIRENVKSMSEEKHAVIHGTPGDSARASGIVRALWPLLLALPICGFCAGLACPVQYRPSLTIAGALLIGAVLLLTFFTYRGLQGINAWFKGARGEEQIAFLLAGLPSGWHVFHDFSLPQGVRADHVVVGPVGIFVIETKFWQGEVRLLENGQILVNGQKPSRPPLDQARRQGQLFSEWYERSNGQGITAFPILCFAGETFAQESQKWDGVLVCNASRLVSLLQGWQGHLSNETVERVVKLMEQKAGE